MAFSASVTALSLVLTLTAVLAAEVRVPRRVFTVQGPLPSPPGHGDELQAVLQQVALEQGLQQGLEGLQQGLQQGRSGAATIQLTVPSIDVEPLRRFLRSHYRLFWLRMFPKTHSDGDVFAAPDGSCGSRPCDEDSCFGDCFLRGFPGGACIVVSGDVQCICAIPPAPTTTTASTEAVTEVVAVEADGS